MTNLSALKPLGLLWLAIAGVCLSVNGAVYTTGGSFDNITGAIPDGSAAGWSDTRTLSGIINEPLITDVSVTINLSGGFNGDLYAYLSHDGVLVPLINRVGVTSGDGFGYSGSRFSVTLSSSGSYDIHYYATHSPSYNGDGQLTGTWQPDGRNIDPQSSGATFDSAPRTGFEAFNNLNPNGNWTLFFADMSSGGGQSQMVSWQLDVTSVVPEPTNIALGILGAGFFLHLLRSASPKLRSLSRRKS